MSKSIGLLLAIVAVLALIVAFNPEARANAVEAWEQVKVAWSDLSAQFNDSMGALQGGYAQDSGDESAAREDGADGLSVSAFLRDFWVSVSSSLRAR